MSGCGTKLFAATGVFLSCLYLLNLSGGFIEIPDNLPMIGNIDEALATAILISCLSVFGVRLPMAKHKKANKTGLDNPD
jgi:hypothetical protein